MAKNIIKLIQYISSMYIYYIFLVIIGNLLLSNKKQDYDIYVAAFFVIFLTYKYPLSFEFMLSFYISYYGLLYYYEQKIEKKKKKEKCL